MTTSCDDELFATLSMRTASVYTVESPHTARTTTVPRTSSRSSIGIPGESCSRARPESATPISIMSTSPSFGALRMAHSRKSSIPLVVATGIVRVNLTGMTTSSSLSRDASAVDVLMTRSTPVLLTTIMDAERVVVRAANADVPKSCLTAKLAVLPSALAKVTSSTSLFSCDEPKGMSNASNVSKVFAATMA